MVPADEAEPEPGHAGPQPPEVAVVAQPTVEGKQQHQRDEPDGRADLHGAHAVEVEGVDVGDDVGAVADLVHHRLVVVGLHVRHSNRPLRTVPTRRRDGRLVGFRAWTRSSRSPSVARPSAREVRGGVVTFFTMAYIIVLNPLILGFAAGRRRQAPRRRRRPATSRRSRPAPRWSPGVMTILMGVVANFPLALATGLGLNAFVAFAIASQMTWADAMGLVVHRGHGDPGAGAHRLPGGRLPRGAGPAQDRDLGRHRPVHRADRLRRRRASCAGSPTPPTPPSRCSSGPAAASRAGRSLVFVHRAGARDRAVGAPGQGRDPDLDRGHHRAGDRRRGDRRVRPGRRREPRPAGA